MPERESVPAPMKDSAGQDVVHVEQAEILASKIARCPDTALCVGGAAAGTVRDLDSFARTTEIDGVVADDVPAAHNGETDAARFPCAGFTMPRPVGDVVQVFAPGVSNRFTHGQGRTRGRIHLVAMVRFENFNVITAVEQAGSHFQQLESDIDANTHVW